MDNKTSVEVLEKILLEDDLIFSKREAIKQAIKVLSNDGVELIHEEMGSLEQIATALLKEMREEVKRNGNSDLTLGMEGSARGIGDIIELNNITEKRLDV